MPGRSAIPGRISPVFYHKNAAPLRKKELHFFYLHRNFIPTGIKSLCSNFLKKLRPEEYADLARRMNEYPVQRRAPKRLLSRPVKPFVHLLPAPGEYFQQMIQAGNGGRRAYCRK